MKKAKTLFIFLVFLMFFSFFSSSYAKELKVDSGAALLIETNTGRVLYEKNSHKKMYPASTTKILTALVALKYGDLEQVITVSEEAAKRRKDASNIELPAGDQLTLNQVLYGLMLPSGNDCAVALAEAVGNSVSDFVLLMNRYAEKLGCTHSHFTNPHGLDDEYNYSTAFDMYLFLKYH